MRTLYITLLIIISGILLSGCTTNNGPHHDIYGMWKVEQIFIDGEPEQGYQGDLFLMFQNDVVRTVGLTSSYGMWQETDNYSEITIWFDIEGQKPYPSAHFAPDEPNICKVLTLNRKSFVFDMTNPKSDAVYRYQMVKW